MPREDRLKKRTAVPQNRTNDTGDPESGFNRNENPMVGTHHISAPTSRTRRRYKGSGSKNKRVFVRRLKRMARSCASRQGIKNRSALSSNLKRATSLVCFIVACFVIYAINKTKFRNDTRQQEFKIFFPQTKSANFSQSFFQMDPIAKNKSKKDYGGLKIGRIGKKRQISDFDYLSTTDFRDPHESRDDDGNDAYEAFDDDFLRGTEGTMNKNPTGKVCHRTTSHRVSYQNCNAIYELDLVDNHVKYLNAGSYRQVFSLKHSFGQEHETVAVKDMYQRVESKASNYEFVRMDAMVAERLTSSPRIYDIYGFCGLSVLSEYFPHGDMEDIAISQGNGYLSTEEDQEDYLESLDSYNDLSSEDVLVISLQMAESIADLHGHKDGVITHQDIQLGQFLFNADKSLVKLNDFNRAEFMLFDEKGHEYCKYGEGVGNGSWRSPEEYFDYDLDEKVDIYSLGNNMYSLLTGLYPNYDSESDEVSIERVKKGLKPYIDPGYLDKGLAEAKMAEIINRCYAYQPEDRPSIFEVVKFLRDALAEFRKKGDLEQVKD